MMDAAIRQPELLMINDQALITTNFGCDQSWFADYWQRQAGCGPCTAATVLYYLARSRSFLDHLYTASSHVKEDFTHFMADIWHYVTPGNMGVNEASILSDGVIRYASDHGVDLTAEIFKVPAKRSRQAPFTSFLDFIRDGLDHDCPVAFLNLSNGRLKNLESWHWITITALSASDATVSDSGQRKVIDLEQWYRSSWIGGGAVWFKVGPSGSVGAVENLDERRIRPQDDGFIAGQG